MTEITSCEACAVGRASGVGHGGVCPFVARVCRAGETLYAAGDPTGSVFFVKRGEVVETDDEGRACALRRPGDLVGLDALIRPRYARTARACSLAVVCVAPLSTVDTWLGDHDAPARVALEQAVAEAYLAPPRMAAPDGNAIARVARWLLHEDKPATPRRHVASLLGMTPETLSRALAKLAADGAIALTRRTVTVRDRDRLERAAA